MKLLSSGYTSTIASTARTDPLCINYTLRFGIAASGETFWQGKKHQKAR
ncbi:hypothetical protein XELAEV_18041561mg [Xenopus laevis]|uniref:Uncharacterized protein n=1 Tax=Xenopus laevis TaxID=8355 RepID=A0A974C2P6_XENLA|nr:hypothetical protein XELAEV_18041561mg [Xenopus laevis]